MAIKTQADGGWWCINGQEYKFDGVGSNYQWLDYCRKFVKPGTCVLDVGAALGAWTIPLMWMVEDGLVISVEPNPEAFECLKRNVARRTGKTELHNCAVGTGDKTQMFVINLDNMFTSALEENPVHEGSTRKRIRVEVKSLDSLDNGELPISFIKIDVEGSEIDVIESGLNLIRKHRPVMWVEAFDRPGGFAKGGKDSNYMKSLVDGLGYTFEWHGGGNPGHDLLFIPSNLDPH